jgi:transforming growth factor-beta-induced protein
VDSIEMLNGDNVTVEVNGTSIKINGADVVSADHFPYNGVIHALDEIFIPPTMTQTIAEIASGNPNFSTLVSLVSAKGLLSALEGEGPLTVYAPTNAAFDAISPFLMVLMSRIFCSSTLLARMSSSKKVR